MKINRILYFVVTFLTAIAFSTISFAFTPDTELEQYADELDRKYFPIFLKTLDMINERQFDSLEDFYSEELLNEKRTGTMSISIRTWDGHPEIYFKSKKHLSSPALDERGYKLSFPIGWGANPANDKTWVFNFHNLLWLNEYLVKGEQGDEASALAAFKVIRDWITANGQWPPKHGRFVFGDHSTAERLKVFYRALRLYEKSRVRDNEFHHLLLTGILNHIAIMSTEEKYLNWHNHGVIFDVSLLEVLNDLEEFKMRRELQELAARRVQEQFRFSFTEEGVHKEHSPCYHYFVTGMLLKVINLIEKSGQTTPASLKDLVGKTAEFYTYVLEPDGSFPNIGDCSGGKKWVMSGELGEKYYKDHPELMFSLTSGKEGKKPAETIKVFPESGWVVFRDKWPSNIYAVVQSDFNSFGHYQEDDTSFVLYAFGHDFIIDNGLHSYNRNPLDIYMRKSRAHNVLVVDDTDFNFNLANTGLSGITRYILNKNSEEQWEGVVELTHAHYDHMGIKIYRQFGQIDESSFMVKDLMESGSPHKYTQLFHLAPSARVEFKGKGTFKITWPDHPYILWLKSNFYSYDIIEGAMDPVQGWYFPKFGVSSPQPVLRLHKKETSGEFATFISLSRGYQKPDWKELNEAVDEMSEAIEKLSRKELTKQPVPARWVPSRKQ